MSGIISRLCKVFQHNWLATLYFNFRMLPFSQAIHLPFDFAHSVRFASLKGKVRLNVEGRLHRAMVRVGGRDSDIMPRRETVILIDGELEVRGDCVELGNGVSLVVREGGHLSLGRKNRLGAMCKIYCARRIEIGDEVGISWECQIYDTNFHSMRDCSTGLDIHPDGEVHIGSCNWIGNRCSICKGTYTPDRLIVASNSLLNRDYRSVPVNSMVAGQPARVVKSNVIRLFEGRDI